MNEKLQFVVEELWILAWAASVQHAKLYKEKAESGPDSAAASKFRSDVIKFLVDKIIPQYEGDSCYEEDHYKNISALIAYADEVDPGILGKAGYKYGVAQKLLNLALKYYWCLGLISEPPHFPIDRIIIEKTRYRGKVNWTQITERSQYEEIIREIKQLASIKGLSITEWELACFGRR
jgi:hypothetical protein